MFGSTILDVAIGMIFVYSVFSMVATKLNDIIASWMKWRSKTLEEGIRTLLADPELANKVWNHPLVRGLVGKKGRAASYIPPNTLALALFDTIVPTGETPTALETMRAKVAEMPEGQARQAILSILDSASGDVDKALLRATDWFDSAMDRVADMYKSKMQTLSILVALSVSVLFNADSLAIANGLWQEPTVRAAVAGAALRTTPPDSTQPMSTTQSKEAVQEVIASVSGLGLPLGWNTFPATAWGWVQKVLGLLLTTLAVSLGAPFWYDLLKNLSTLRQQQKA
jgi:hypothetical protein